MLKIMIGAMLLGLPACAFADWVSGSRTGGTVFAMGVCYGAVYTVLLDRACEKELKDGKGKAEKVE